MTFSDISRSIRELLNSHGMPEREVYLDNENSGFIMPEALEAMEKAYREEGKGHPSITHRAGWAAYETLYESTSKIASTLHCNPYEIIYTHSGTEANNLAIAGSAEKSYNRRKILV